MILNKSKIFNIVLVLIIIVLVIINRYYSANTYSTLDYTYNSIDTIQRDTLTTRVSLGVKSEIYPKPVFVIGSYDEKGTPNIMTASWGGIASSKPLTIAVSMRPATYSYHNVTKNMAFTVNIPSENMAEYVDFAGVFSGKDMNKFEEMGLTPVKGEFVNAPYIKEFPIVAECKVIEFHDIGSHRQFIGEVVNISAVSSILKDGNVDPFLLKPLQAGRGIYYGMGDFIGKSRDIYKLLTDETPTVMPYPRKGMNKTLQTIFNRKSVRHFTEQKVNKEQLVILTRAGMAAPTAVNRQPWTFFIITEREKLDTLASQLPYAKMLAQAQAAIVVCGDLQKALKEPSQDYWIQDCSAASQNILLAAESMGLGAVWTATYPYEDRINTVRETLELPNHIIPLNVIPIGYPTGEDKPKDKWKPENLFWNEWEE